MYAERWPSSLCRLVQPETTDIKLLDGLCRGTSVQDGMQDAWDGLVSRVALVHTVTTADRYLRRPLEPETTDTDKLMVRQALAGI